MSKPIGLFGFVNLVALANLILFQGPLNRFAVSVADLPQMQGVLQLATVQVIGFCLLVALLLLLSALSLRLMKLVAVALFLTNAAALYFMQTYGIVFDRSMIGNILNTDTREASELWHAGMLPYVLGLGAVPGALIWAARIRPPRRYWRVAGAAGAVIAMCAWIFATSFTWLWFDRHATLLGGKILPWSYVANTARYLNRTALANRAQELLPDASFAEDSPARKQIVVLIIGEAARADHLSLYGYGRDTEPFTAGMGLIALPAGDACSTNTIASTACIVTHEGRAASPRTGHEPLLSYLTRHGVETLYRSNNSGPPPMQVSKFEHARDIAAGCSGAECPDGRFDAALNWRLGEILTQSEARRILVTLHQTGSHGPAYFSKYPDDFKAFTPVCDTVQIADCSQEELVNAYDNTIRYTDSLLADLIAQLAAVPDADAVLLYVADHGQSLGEGGFYLHGAPMAIAPEAQRKVPFLVWMSESFKASRGLAAGDIQRAESFPHDFPFHSVMGAFGMTSAIYKPEYDLFNPSGKDGG